MNKTNWEKLSYQDKKDFNEMSIYLMLYNALLVLAFATWMFTAEFYPMGFIDVFISICFVFKAYKLYITPIDKEQ